MRTVPPAPPAALAADPDALIFQWERRSWSRLRLLPMVVFSLVAHAASFYVLQVAYTPTGSQLPPPAQVVLVRLDQPENAALAHWLEVTDPALMSRPNTPTAAQALSALNFRYTPSYVAAPPDFKDLEAPGASQAAVSVPPRPRAAGLVPASLLPPLAPGAPLPPAPAATGRTTRVVFSGGLAALAPAQLPPVRFVAAKGAKIPEPTVFLVGARSSGGGFFLFRQPVLVARQAASGDAEAENYARDYLAHLSFQTRAAADGEEAVTWGWATFYWGATFIHPKADGERPAADRPGRAIIAVPPCPPGG